MLDLINYLKYSYYRGYYIYHKDIFDAIIEDLEDREDDLDV